MDLTAGPPPTFTSTQSAPSKLVEVKQEDTGREDYIGLLGDYVLDSDEEQDAIDFIEELDEAVAYKD